MIKKREKINIHSFLIGLLTIMAEEQLLYTEINATLTNILSELKGQKRELSSIKEDVRENCLSVSSDVKKTLKIQRDLLWKYEGNKIQ